MHINYYYTTYMMGELGYKRIKLYTCGYQVIQYQTININSEEGAPQRLYSIFLQNLPLVWLGQSSSAGKARARYHIYGYFPFMILSSAWPLVCANYFQPQFSVPNDNCYSRVSDQLLTKTLAANIPFIILAANLWRQYRGIISNSRLLEYSKQSQEYVHRYVLKKIHEIL